MIFTFHAVNRFIERFPKQAQMYGVKTSNGYSDNIVSINKYLIDVPFRKIKTPQHKIESNDDYYVNDDGVVLVTCMNDNTIKTCLLLEYLEPQYAYGETSYSLRTYEDFCMNIFENNHKIYYSKILELNSGIVYQAQYANFKKFVIGDKNKQNFRELTSDEDNKLHRYLTAVERPLVNPEYIKIMIPYSLEYNGVKYYYGWNNGVLNIYKLTNQKKKKYIPVDSIDDEKFLLEDLTALIAIKHSSIKEPYWEVFENNELHFVHPHIIFNISADLKKRAINEYQKLSKICCTPGIKTFEELNLSNYLSDYLSKLLLINDIENAMCKKHTFIENLYFLQNKDVFLYSESPIIDFTSLLNAKYIKSDNEKILKEIFHFNNISDVPLENIKNIRGVNYLEFMNLITKKSIQIENVNKTWRLNGIVNKEQFIIQKAKIVMDCDAFFYRAYEAKTKIPYAVLDPHNYIYKYEDEDNFFPVYYQVHILTKQKKLLNDNEISKIHLLKKQEEEVKTAFLNDKYIINSMLQLSSNRTKIHATNTRGDSIECELWYNQEIRLYESSMKYEHEGISISMF